MAEQIILYRMPAGVPGATYRAEHLLVTTEVVTPFGGTNAPSFFGQGLVVDATTGLARAFFTGDTTVDGFLVRAYPTQGGQADNFGGGTIPASGPIDLMRRGYMTVTLYGATAAVKGGIVYVRASGQNGTTTFQGGVEAASGSGLVALPSRICYFNGPADASGITEIAFNI